MVNYKRLKASLLEAGQLFEDEDFEAEESSLHFTAKPSWSDIEWKRPKEICDDPQFMIEGSSRFDLSQGILGNCWFVSAACTLATRKALLKKVVPFKQTFNDEDYAGIFKFSFWRWGEWQEVVVDDRLPTRNGRLVFCCNRYVKNEFWPALMEKAYAKVHGSYQALETGYSSDALVDFTGGIGEFIDLSKDYENRGQLFKLLRKSMKMRSLMCAAIEVKDGGSYEDKLENGLVTGHAYSITNVLTVATGDEKHKLVRVRNPWGHREWNGPWSDGSSEWEKISEEEKEKCDLRTENDGEFWMPYEDFLQNFHTIQLCHLGPDSVLEKNEVAWHTSSYDGAWVRGVSAGGCGAPPGQATYWLNPQYVIKLVSPDVDDDGMANCTLVISLIQKYRRQLKTINQSSQDFEEAIGFDILQVKEGAECEEGDSRLNPAALRMQRKMTRYEHLRERSGRYNLQPGTYCVVPCTFRPGTEAEFILRLATEQPAESSEFESPSEPTEHMKPTSGTKVGKFQELFAKHAGEDDIVDARELKQMLNDSLRRGDDRFSGDPMAFYTLHTGYKEGEEEFDKETARALITMELGSRGKMDKSQCKRVWKEVKRLQTLFDEFDTDENRVLDKKEMRKAFNCLGFKLTKKILVQIAQHYCGKNESLTLDDFVLLSAKLSVQFEKYNKLIEKDSSKVNMTLDEWLESTILS